MRDLIYKCNLLTMSQRHGLLSTAYKKLWINWTRDYTNADNKHSCVQMDRRRSRSYLARKKRCWYSCEILMLPSPYKIIIILPDPWQSQEQHYQYKPTDPHSPECTTCTGIIIVKKRLCWCSPVSWATLLNSDVCVSFKGVFVNLPASWVDPCPLTL